jgi:phospholipase A1/A2
MKQSPLTLLLLPYMGLLLLCAGVPFAHAEEVSVSTDAVAQEVAIVTQKEDKSALGERRAKESIWRQTGLLILPYRPNYLLPYSNNFGHNTGGLDTDNTSLQDIEAKFQISLRMPIARGLFWNHGDFQIAYTQVSFWQVYNKRISAPFRETNYEPEAMLTFDSDFGSTHQIWDIGVSHQSNGREDPNSRSWNRIYVQGVFAKGNGVISIKPWIRLSGNPNEDDNPDILHYMGNFELRGAYKWRQQVAAFMLRNNLDTHENRGAVELSYSFPLVRLLRGYVQYFNGYGESLIEYTHNANRISVGLAFSDWL